MAQAVARSFTARPRPPVRLVRQQPVESERLSFAINAHSDLIPQTVREPFPPADRPIASFEEVWAKAYACFAEAAAEMSAGLSLLWVYFRVWLACLRRDIRHAIARAGQSLPLAHGFGFMGWGFAITISAIHLLWR